MGARPAIKVNDCVPSHDKGPGALTADFARELRTRSPYVDAALLPGAGHGVAGAEYPSRVLGFAERCAAAVTTAQLLG